MIDGLVLEYGDIELVIDERFENVCLKRYISTDAWEWPRPGPFIGNLEPLTDPERESRVHVEKERRAMVVLEEHQGIHFFLSKPFGDRLVPFEQGSPRLILLFFRS